MGEKSKFPKEKKRIVKTNSIDFLSDQRESVAGITNEYPYVMHITEYSEGSFPWHWHEEVEFGYVLSGEEEVITADRTYHLKKGEGYFMNSNILASMRKTSKECVMVTHLFHPTFLSGHFRSLFETKYIDPVIHNKNLDVIILKNENENQKEIMKKLKQASYLQKEEDTEFQTRNIFSEIWLLIMKEMKTQPTHSVNLRNQDRIQSMITFIQQNFAEKISLEDIAQSASVSTRECIRCFQNTIKKSPMEYLISIRLKEAKKLLAKTDMTVTEISMQTGFSSNAYFGKVFRERCNMTPAKYRSSIKAEQ